jgi:hypothetical protein
MNNRTPSLDLKQKLVILNILHQGGLITMVKSYVHMPHILQKVALGPGRLLTTYVTTFYSSYI